METILIKLFIKYGNYFDQTFHKVWKYFDQTFLKSLSIQIQ